MTNYWIPKLGLPLRRLLITEIVFQADKEFTKMQTKLAASFAVVAEAALYEWTALELAMSMLEEVFHVRQATW